MDNDQLNRDIINCNACQRLVEYRGKIAEEKRASYREYKYWAKPVPNLGDPKGRLLIVGLAPGAHGSNRTGRMFTGDRSGEWLFKVLKQTQFSSHEHTGDLNDGLIMRDCLITAVLHCAPPGNKPDRTELSQCRPYFNQTIEMMPNLKVIVALGKIAFDEIKRYFTANKIDVSKMEFRHGADYSVNNLLFIASYHPSQQNTQTGKLTWEMLTSIFIRVRKALD